MQADSLQKLCETREERIQENKRKIEEARLVSKEEATNFKEANEIIEMLTSKVIHQCMYLHNEYICVGQLYQCSI